MTIVSFIGTLGTSLMETSGLSLISTEKTDISKGSLSMYKLTIKMDIIDVDSFKDARILWNLVITIDDIDNIAYHSVATIPFGSENIYSFVQVTDTHIGRAFLTDQITRNAGQLKVIFDAVHLCESDIS
jgi:hypothetical protein